MARVLVTGSSDGLGLIAGRLLAEWGHEVTLHGRNEARAADARAGAPGARAAVVGDLATMAGMRRVAEEANELGPHDAVIHNAAVGNHERRRVVTADGLAELFSVNVLAPYVLTALVEHAAPGERMSRLVYLSSGTHRRGEARLDDLQWSARRWDGSRAYAESKLLDTVLAFAVARRWPDVRSNAVEPGWVPTKMGGPHATDDLALGALTQAWLAVSDDPAAAVTGTYFFHQVPQDTHPAASDTAVQDGLCARCAELTGIELPSRHP